MLLTLFGLVVAIAPQEAERPALPSLCVATRPVAGRELETDQIIVAVRARIARRQLQIMRCSSARAAPTWRLTVEAPERDAVAVTIEGQETLDQRLLPTAGLRKPEVVWLVALTATEVVRPALDALLGQLGIAVEEAPVDALGDLEAALLAEAPPEVETETPAVAVAEPTEPGLLPEATLSAAGGLLAGAWRQHQAAYVEAAASVRWSRLGIRAHAAAHRLPERHRGDVRLDGDVYDAGVAVGVEWEGFGARLGALGRLSALRLRDGASGTGRRPELWDVGGSLELEALAWRFGSIAVGLETRAVLWSQPRRFLIGGEPVYKQSLFELFVGPSVGWIID